MRMILPAGAGGKTCAGEPPGLIYSWPVEGRGRRVHRPCRFMAPLNMGHLSDADHPDVKARSMDALRRIRAAAKAPGILSTRDGMDEMTQFAARGQQF